MWPFKKRAAAPEKSATERSPVDVNQPVENPDLTAALAAFAAEPTPAALQRLQEQLNRAVYLVAILIDEMNITPDGEAGKATFEKGSRIKVLTCTDPAGAPTLPVFSDWREIRAWTDEPVSTLVLPADEVWSWVTGQSGYQGVVVNPAGQPIPLDLPQVRDLQRQASV